jgi:hypothetical protein
LRYDLAVRSPEYVKELVTHHVGGLLKIAPEHSENGPLSKMMKPGMGAYYDFKEMFERFSKEAGKEQYLIPYFIAAHPGTTDEDMLNLALWLKKNNFRLDQVQNFMPTPMAMATAMYHGRKNPLHKVTYESEAVETVRSGKIRRLHKAFLRYHDPENWDILREGLQRMGRSDLIGSSERHLVPRHNPSASLAAAERRKETPSANQIAKKYGQNKPRPGAAIERTPTRTAARTTARTPERTTTPASLRTAGARKTGQSTPRGGRK